MVIGAEVFTRQIWPLLKSSHDIEFDTQTHTLHSDSSEGGTKIKYSAVT